MDPAQALAQLQWALLQGAQQARPPGAPWRAAPSQWTWGPTAGPGQWPGQVAPLAFPLLAAQGVAAQAPTAPPPLQAAAQAEDIKKKESAAAVASAAAGAAAAAAASLAKTKKKAVEAIAAATARAAAEKAAAAKPAKAAVGPEATAAVEEIFEYSHGTGTLEEARDALPRDTSKTKAPPA